MKYGSFEGTVNVPASLEVSYVLHSGSELCSLTRLIHVKDKTRSSTQVSYWCVVGCAVLKARAILITFSRLSVSHPCLTLIPLPSARLAFPIPNNEGWCSHPSLYFINRRPCLTGVPFVQDVGTMGRTPCAIGIAARTACFVRPRTPVRRALPPHPRWHHPHAPRQH